MVAIGVLKACAFSSAASRMLRSGGYQIYEGLFSQRWIDRMIDEVDSALPEIYDAIKRFLGKGL